jgi:hypothetical protein
MTRGRRLDHDRRHQFAELRQQGLTLAEIGRRLGVSRQCVHVTVRSMMRPRVLKAVPCSHGGRDVVSAGLPPRDHGHALYLVCVRQLPETPFGQRLPAHRLAAGMTRGRSGSPGPDRSLPRQRLGAPRLQAAADHAGAAGSSPRNGFPTARTAGRGRHPGRTGIREGGSDGRTGWSGNRHSARRPRTRKESYQPQVSRNNLRTRGECRR